MNRLFSFDEKQEITYRHHTYTNDLVNIRIMLVLCFFFYSIFALIDILVDVPQVALFLTIRFLVVNPFFVIGYVLSYYSYYEKIHQWVLFIAYIAAGSGIVVMLVIAPNNFSYYGGLFLIFAVGHFMTKMYWTYMTGASLIIISFFASSAFWYSTSNEELLVYLFFYGGFIIICVYASYNAEISRRIQFLQTQNLEGDKVVLEKEIYTKLLDIENANRITIFSLARLSESKDHFTGDHIERVGTLCLNVSEVLDDEIYQRNRIDKETFIKAIELASTLHDIGKVAIPESILMKPGRLTDDEMTVMKKHTIYGYDTLMKIRERYEKNDFINMGIDICKYHHERWDGKGYPVGLAMEQIPLSARIVSIVDVFDALISERPYKKAYSLDRALDIIYEGSGTMFDPEIVEIFMKVYGKNLDEDH